MVVIATSISGRKLDEAQKPDLNAQIRSALRRAIRMSGKSRLQIVDELNGRHGVAISVHILNNWTGDSKRERRIPAEIIPALCDALNDDSLQRLLMSTEQIAQLQLGKSVAAWLDRKRPGAKRRKEV